MRKLFTVDDFMVAFVAALGYGYGETMAQLFGWPEPLCIVACFAVGIAVEVLVDKIVFSEAVQRSLASRICAYAVIILVFLAGHYVSSRWMGVSMVEYVEEEFLWVVGLPIVGFVVNLIIRWNRIRRIRENYGDGAEGYVFDVDEKEVEELNKRNRPVGGEYDADCTAKTRTGVYVGEKDGNAVSYLGIPYAKAPVGELRWKAPEPLPSSDAVFEARHFGASAIQVEHKGAILKHHRQSEDCLNLNVFVGSQDVEARRPVLVLFHHGDFAYGGSADPLLDGANLVREHPDIVFVSFNYRLGVFGFIDFSGIPGGEAYADAPNLGLLDQIAALRWVKENIAAFGGDPERVTAVGFESGATCICMLAASEEAKGLFSRAFVFNGNPTEPYHTAKGPRPLAKELLEETRTATIDELARLEAETLKEAARRHWWDMCVPALDGKLVPTDLYRAYQESAAADVEFIVGIPSGESRVYRSFYGGLGYEELISAEVADILRSLDGPRAAAVRGYIEGQAASSSELEAKAKLVDQWIALCVYRSAVKLSEGGGKVHLMYWNRKPLIENLGSGMVDVAATLFGKMYGSVADADLSEITQVLLRKFVNGDALQLHRNEVYGIDAFNWEPFPKALVVSDDECHCDMIEGSLTEVEGLTDYIMR